MKQTEIIGIAGALSIVAIIGLKYGTNNNTNKNQILDLLLENEKEFKSVLAKNKGITDLEFLEDLEEQKKKERDAINESYERQVKILEKRRDSVSHLGLDTTKKLEKPDYIKEVHENVDMIWEDRNANKGRGKKHGTKKKRGKKK